MGQRARDTKAGRKKIRKRIINEKLSKEQQMRKMERSFKEHLIKELAAKYRGDDVATERIKKMEQSITGEEE